MTYPVGRPLVAGLAAAGVWLAGAVVTVLWMHASALGWRQAAGACALAIAGAWSLRSWLRSATGELAWNGVDWTTAGSAIAGGLDVTLDLQSVLLVRWRASDCARWLWLERWRAPLRWADLRRAVYSRATSHPLPPARPPAAIP
ncbi:MAG: hypothetical protein NVS3B2_05130 [Ramlibacter sp.]